MNNVNVQSSQRLLIIGGLLLIISGMIFGDIFAVFILHPNISNLGQEMYAAAQAVMAQDGQSISAHFSRMGAYLENAGTKIDTHVHIIKFGYLALILALIQPYILLSDHCQLRLAQLYLAGAVILPPSVFLIHYVGLAYSPFESIGWASISADLGGFLVIIACTGELFGLFKYIMATDKTSLPQMSETPMESRALLAGGCVLLLTGFLFGAYYAAIHLDQNEAREITTLNTVLEKTMDKDSEGIGRGLDEYGLLQGQRGVSIAAHAHINEFGMLALLLAFVQPFVFLSCRWRRRWVKLMLFGSILLPISVLSELQIGLPAMILADTGGLLIIIALFGMFMGVVRHTGRQDAGSGAGT